MRRLGLTLALLFLLIAARSERAVTLQSGDTAHCTADALVLTSAVDARCVAFTPTPTATATAVAAPAATSTGMPPPTATATATATPIATATATATPLASLPLCQTHDQSAWHALIDSTRQCHYDHEHGDDPALGDAIFGPVGASWGGTPFGFAWHTSPVEMTLKHGGMKVAVRLNRPCTSTDYDGHTPVNCITDARVIYHTVGHAMDALARYHSYYLEYRVCAYPAFTQCGILRIGGWMDLGVLNAPYAGLRLFRPGGTVDFGLGSTYGGAGSPLVLSYAADTPDLDQIAPVGGTCCDEPYISIGSLLEPANASRLSVWSMNNVGQFNYFGSNPYARFIIRTFDSWGWIDPNNVNAPLFFCRDGICADNGSLRGLGEDSVWIPSAWDTDGDGFSDVSGFTNRFGQIVTGCTAVAMDCVPFSAVHVPVGYADTRDPGNGISGAVEYDTAPAGQHWIQFPN